jgi:hypothetical protein
MKRDGKIRIWGHRIWGNWVLRSILRGVFWAALIILIVLFATGQESRFIYTDF